MRVMIGAVLIVLALLVVLPALFWAGAGVVAGVLGWLLMDNAEATHEGSELIATNV